MELLNYNIICYVLALATCRLAAQTPDSFSYAICKNMAKILMNGDECGVNGKWVNQLNSTMELCGMNSNLYGKYSSSVGRAENYYVLRGRYTVRGADCIMGWSVAYNNAVYGNSNSTASWVGIHYADESTIYTQWLLARYQEKESFWMAFNTNQDVFRRDE